MPAQQIRKVSPDDVAPNRRLGGEIRILLSPGTVGATSGFLGIGQLPPGERGVMHYHPHSEEFMYLVSGTLEAVVDGERIIVNAGEALMIPKGVHHRLDNRGDEPAVGVFNSSPLAPRPELGHVVVEDVPRGTELKLAVDDQQ